MLLENPEVPVFFRIHLEMVVSHSPVTLIKTYVVYICGINTYKVANDRFLTLKAILRHLKPWERVLFHYYSSFLRVCGTAKI